MAEPGKDDWMKPAGIAAIVVGGLAFLASAVKGGGIVAGLLNPLFFIGVPLGLYWLNQCGFFDGVRPNSDTSQTPHNNSGVVPPIDIGGTAQHAVRNAAPREKSDLVIKTMIGLLVAWVVLLVAAFCVPQQKVRTDRYVGVTTGESETGLRHVEVVPIELPVYERTKLCYALFIASGICFWGAILAPFVVGRFLSAERPISSKRESKNVDSNSPVTPEHPPAPHDVSAGNPSVQEGFSPEPEPQESRIENPAAESLTNETPPELDLSREPEAQEVVLSLPDDDESPPGLDLSRKPQETATVLSLPAATADQSALSKPDRTAEKSTPYELIEESFQPRLQTLRASQERDAFRSGLVVGGIVGGILGIGIAIAIFAATESSRKTNDNPRSTPAIDPSPRIVSPSETLKGIGGVRVIVEDLNDDAHAARLSKRDFQWRVRTTLQNAEIPTDDSAAGYLYLQVTAISQRSFGISAAACRLSYKQYVGLPAVRARGAGETWDSAMIVTAGTQNLRNEVNAAIDKLLMEFVKDYRAANPTSRAIEGGPADDRRNEQAKSPLPPEKSPRVTAKLDTRPQPVPARLKGRATVTKQPPVNPLVGKWKFERFRKNGKTEIVAKDQFFVITTEMFEFKAGAESYAAGYVFDASKTPAQLDILVQVDGKKTQVKYIVQRIGNFLAICGKQKPDGSRPKSFAAESNDKQQIFLLRLTN